MLESKPRIPCFCYSFLLPSTAAVRLASSTRCCCSEDTRHCPFNRCDRRSASYAASGINSARRPSVSHPRLRGSENREQCSDVLGSAGGRQRPHLSVQKCGKPVRRRHSGPTPKGLESRDTALVRWNAKPSKLQAILR